MAKHRNPLPTPEEKQEKKKQQKVDRLRRAAPYLAVVVGLLVVCYFWFTYFGNPFTKMKAEKSIQTHIDTYYAGAQMGKVHFERETVTYYAEITHPDSPDTRFTVTTRGFDCSDNYDNVVKGLQNTIERLEDEVTATAAAQLAAHLPAGATVQMQFADFEDTRDSGKITLDMPVASLDGSLPFTLHVTANGEPTVQAVAQLTQTLKPALPALYPVTYFNITLVGETETVQAFNIPVDTAALEQTLQEAFERPTSSFMDLTEDHPLYVTVQPNKE